MPVFEVTIIGTKTFYIEAESEEAAIDNELTVDAMTSSVPEVDEDWEPHEAKARKLDSQEDFPINSFYEAE